MAQRTSVATNVRLSVSPSTSSSEGRWVGLAIGGLWVQPPPAWLRRPTNRAFKFEDAAALWWHELCTQRSKRDSTLRFKRQSTCTKHYTKRPDPFKCAKLLLRFTKLLGALAARYPPRCLTVSVCATTLGRIDRTLPCRSLLTSWRRALTCWTSSPAQRRVSRDSADRGAPSSHARCWRCSCLRRPPLSCLVQTRRCGGCGGKRRSSGHRRHRRRHRCHRRHTRRHRRRRRRRKLRPVLWTL